MTALVTDEEVRKYFLKSPEKVRNVYTVAGFIIIAFGGFLTAVLTSYLTGRTILASALTGLPLFLFGRVMPAKTRDGGGRSW
jgi:hypothetical protein